MIGLRSIQTLIMASGFGAFLLLQIIFGIIVGIIYGIASIFFAVLLATNPLVFFALVIAVWLFATFIGFMLLFRGRSFR